MFYLNIIKIKLKIRKLYDIIAKYSTVLLPFLKKRYGKGYNEGYRNT